MNKRLSILVFVLIFVSTFVGAVSQYSPVIISLYSIKEGDERIGNHRSPVVPPRVYLEGYTLTFDASCIDCPISLVKDDITVYETIVSDENGVVTLPSELTGEYELRITRGDYIFSGYIEL